MAEMTAVQKRQTEELEKQKQKSKNAWGLLQELGPSIKAVLPRHLTPERMAMIAFTAMKKTPRLLECSRDSIVGSIMTAAMLGLEPSGPLGHGALIPYWNSKAVNADGSKGGFECQFQPMYQGLLDLGRRSGFIKSVQLRAVYKGDTYSYRFGLDPDITHIPMEGEGADEPDREVTHVYCIIELAGGGVQWDQMSWRQGIAHGLRFSPSSEGKKFKAGSVWAENPLPMVLKTILKMVLKLCPKSPELSAALLQDDGAEMGRKMSVTKVGEGVYDVDFGEDPEVKAARERESGTVDLNSLKAGSEENRGHGNDGLDQVKQAAEQKQKVETLEQQRTAKAAQGMTNAPKAETKSPEPETQGEPDPEAVLTDDQHLVLETARTHNNVEMKIWLAWAKKTFDVKMMSQLRHKHFARCLAWTMAGGQEESDAKQ